MQKPVCRYGVVGMSEAPEILPMQPLGAFVRGTGRAIEESELTIYLQRLQEQGWDVRNTVRKALSCGAQLHDQVSLLMSLIIVCSVHHRAVRTVQ